MAKNTKINIFRGLCRLFEAHSLDDITVTMLVEECGISRQTFYYHFSDIESLLRWGIEQGTQGCVKRANQASDMREATLLFLSTVDRGHDTIIKMLNSSYSGYVTVLIKESVLQYITNYAITIKGESFVNTRDSKFLLTFIADGITGGILSAFYENRHIDVEAATDALTSLVFEKYITE